jgi:branched-chain amino acid transport system permease protein
MNYFWHLGILIALYSCLAMTVDLLAGHARLISIAQGAFFGIGAYTYAILDRLSGGRAFVVLPGAFLAGMASSLLLSIPTKHLRGDYFAVATLSLHQVLGSVFENWEHATGGVFGMRGIGSPSLLGARLHAPWQHFLLAVGVSGVTWFGIRRLRTGAYGRLLHATGEDELLASSLGKDVERARRSVLAVSCGLAALAGGCYAGYAAYVDPTSFPVTESILVLSMAFLGGARSAAGPILGAGLLLAIPEFTRLVGLPSAVVGDVRQILFGGALVGLMIWRPQGILGRREVAPW